MLMGIIGGVPPAPGWPDLSALTLTPIGNLTDTSTGGSLAAAFDGTIIRTYAGCAASSSGADALVGLTYGVPRVVYAAVAFAPSDDYFCGGGGSRTARIEGSNDNSSWTTLWTGTYPSAMGGAIYARVLPNTAYLYHRLYLQGDGSTRMRVAQLILY